MPINVGTVSIFAPFNFAALLSSRNKGHVNIKGFTVNRSISSGNDLDLLTDRDLAVTLDCVVAHMSIILFCCQ